MKDERLYKVLLAQHVSEKAQMASMNANQLVFKVAVDATKAEISQSIEKLFGVSVLAVRVVNVKGKRTLARGRKIPAGKRANWRKAYVRLAEGQEIDLGGAL